MKRKITGFLRERLPLKGVENHLKKPLPKHINWLFSLGSMVFFLLLLQAATGAFMAFYYSPSPDHAYDAVNYISKEVPFGAFVRGLHHWGASAIVIIMFLHLLRVVIYGSYKAPRELTWMVGVFLLLVVLGFSFTGYLLPWDQKAYWATVVGTKVAGTVPLIGGWITKILRGGEEIGAVTLTRFYAIHTIWLPWLVFVLIGAHLFLVRYFGSSGLPQNTTEEMQAGKPFYPDQLFEDTVAILILFLILAAFALFVPFSMEKVADPTGANYNPRPEWYFLFLFQLLKYFQGPFEVVGTVVIPTLVILALLSLPFLDKRERAPLRKRPIAIAITSVSVLLLILLTILGGRSPKLEIPTDKAAAADQVEQSKPSTQEGAPADTGVFDLNLGGNDKSQ